MLYTSYYISYKCKWYCTVFAYHVYIYIYTCTYAQAKKNTWGGHLGLAVLKFGLTVSVCIIIGLQGDTWWWLKLILQLVVVINNDSVLWYSCNMLQHICIHIYIDIYLYTIPFLTTCNIYIWWTACIRAVLCLILPILDDLSSPHDWGEYWKLIDCWWTSLFRPSTSTCSMVKSQWFIMFYCEFLCFKMVPMLKSPFSI